jgi:hypothetical protein
MFGMYDNLMGLSLGTQIETPILNILNLINQLYDKAVLFP